MHCVIVLYKLSFVCLSHCPTLCSFVLCMSLSLTLLWSGGRSFPCSVLCHCTARCLVGEGWHNSFFSCISLTLLWSGGRSFPCSVCCHCTARCLVGEGWHNSFFSCISLTLFWSGGRSFPCSVCYHSPARCLVGEGWHNSLLSCISPACIWTFLVMHLCTSWQPLSAGTRVVISAGSTLEFDCRWVCFTSAHVACVINGWKLDSNWFMKSGVFCIPVGIIWIFVVSWAMPASWPSCVAKL